MLKAVVFDLDDTLYDYKGCNTLAEEALFNAIAHEFNVPYEESEKLLHEAKKNVKMRLGSTTAASHNRLLYMQDICEQAGYNPLKYAMKLYDIYWDSMLNCMRLYGYVDPLLFEIKSRGIKTGIITDLTAHIQYRKLTALGLDGKIDFLVTSEEAGAEKPSKQIFELMMHKMRLQAGEVLMIGDNMEKDIMGAKAVGMKTLMFYEGSQFYEEARSLLG